MNLRFVEKFSISVSKNFTAQHFMLDVDKQESLPHGHNYLLKLEFEGAELNPDNYLLDANLIKDLINGFLDKYQGKLLNDLADFKDENPSIELLCGLICSQLKGSINRLGIEAVSVSINEDEHIQAVCRQIL